MIRTKTKRMRRMTICLLMAVVTMNMTAQEAYYRNLPVELKRVSMPQIPDRQVSLKDVGGVGDGVTLCTEAFEKGIAQLSAKGGGLLVVPQGRFVSRSLCYSTPIMLSMTLEQYPRPLPWSW